MRRKTVLLSIFMALLVAAVAAALVGYRASRQHDMATQVDQAIQIAKAQQADQGAETANAAKDAKAADAGEAAAALARGIDMASQAFRDLGKDASDVKAGKLTELQADERSRIVHAPRFKVVMQDLVKAKFPGGDPRAAFALDYTRLVELVLEGLTMQSKVVNGKPVPVDPPRVAVIEAEIQKLNARIPKEMEELKTVQAPNERK